jgi:hypothetical protein
MCYLGRRACGTIDKPDVKVSGKDIRKRAADKLIDTAKQEILKQKVIPGMP